MANIPANFTPEPVNPRDAPPAGPPRFLKHQVYENPRVLAKLDEHAIMVARYPHRTFRELMWDLVYCAKFTDFEKVRILFRWMTSKNMYIIQFEQEAPGSPEEMLTAFRRRKGTFAKIFQVLCHHAGLQCNVINGYAKGVDYHPGKVFKGQPHNHSWNAVSVDGSWHLIDAHWATRYLSSEKNMPENLVYEYDDFYFMMEPQQAIYSHFPEDNKWQLLPRPISLEQYEDLPLAKSQFFKCFMDFLENNHGVVKTKSGKLQMALAFWKPISFTFKLVFADNFEEEFKGTDLKSYVLQETVGNRINFFLRLPKKADYYLTVYAQHIPKKLTVETTFRAACEYKIVADKASDDPHPFPRCSDTNWGPGYPVQSYGIVPKQKDGVISAPNGVAEVDFFKLDPKVSLLAKLKKPGMDEQTLDRCVEEKDSGTEAKFKVNLPQKGEYGLEVYANKPEDGTTYTHMCQYMVNYPEKGKDAGKDFHELNNHAPYMSDHKPNSMVKPYGDYTPGTETLADGLEHIPRSKAHKKGQPLHSQTAQGPKHGPDGVYEEEVPPPPPAFLQPDQAAHQTPYGYNPANAEEPLTYPSLAAQAYAPGGMFHGQPTGYTDPYSQETDEQTTPGSGPYSTEGGYPYQGQAGSGAPYGEMRGPPGARGQRGGPGDRDSDYGRGGPDDRYGPGYGTGGRGGPGDGDRYGTGGRGGPGDGDRYGTGGRGGPGDDRYGTGGRGGPGGPDDGRYGTGGRGGPGGQDDRYGPGYGTGGRGGPGDGDRYGTGGRGGPDDGRYGGPGGRGGPGGYGTGPRDGDDGRGSKYGTDDAARYRPGEEQMTAAYAGPGQQSAAPGGYGGSRSPPGGGRGGDRAPGTYRTSIAVDLLPPEDFTMEKVSTAQSAPAPAPAPTAQESELYPQEADNQERFQHVDDRAVEESELYPQEADNQERFQHVDDRAVEVARVEHANFRVLLYNLIYAPVEGKPDQQLSELERARAIFLWLCSKDLNNINFDTVARDSPEEILMGLKTGKTTYAQIYEILCSYAGLYCVIISGYAKGADYRPGMKFSGRQGQHSWNAVLVNGIWRLVDCHWAARRLIGKHASAENVRYELDLYYFGPNPAQLIYTHFPEESDWQLLKRPISLNEFEQLAPVKSAFFKYGLTLVSHRQAVIECDGETEIRIGLPQQSFRDLAFTFSISEENGQDEYRGTKLSKYGMQEVLDKTAVFRLRFPQSNPYKLLIYAKEIDPNNKDAVYGAVCEYKVVAKVSPGKNIRPYPPCPQTTWGPQEAASRYPTTPLQSRNVLYSPDGKLEVRFQMNVPMNFMGKLKSANVSEKDLEGCIIQHTVGEKANFNLCLPEAGEFGLEIYANEEKRDGKTLFHIWQYLIIADKGSAAQGLPKIPPGYLGPQAKFNDFGLKTVSHPDPYIVTSETETIIELHMDQPLRLTSQLIFASRGANDDVSNYVLQQVDGKRLIFICKTVKPGAYKFQIFANPYTVASDSLPGVYNYMIDTSGSASDTAAYPKQFSQWKEGCYLYTPQTGHLTQSLGREAIQFKIDVSKAQAVAVVVGDEWTHLDKVDEARGTWAANVPFGDAAWGKLSKVSVCANYGSSSTSYGTLLEYTL